MAYVVANGRDLIITSLETITAFNPANGDYLFTLDELQDATISQTEDSNDIVGKNGRLLARMKRNKACTISGTNGLISSGLLALQTGGDFETGGTYIMWTDYLTVGGSAGGVTATTYKAVGTSGAEIEHLFVKDSQSGTITRELTQIGSAATMAAHQFKWNSSTNELTFYTNGGTPDVPDGTEIVVMYKRYINADVLKNDSGKYSGKGQLYVDALGEDKCGQIYRVQFFFPKVSFNGEFSIDFGDNQVVHAFEASAEAGACGGGANYFTYTVFGANTADAAVPNS